MLVAFGLQTVNLVAAQHVTRMYHQGNRAQLQRLVTACARASLAVALPAALVFVVLGEWLVRWVVGVEYIGAAATELAMLSFGQLANASMGSVGLLLNMTDHEGIVARRAALAGGGGNIVANLARSQYGEWRVRRSRGLARSWCGTFFLLGPLESRLG